MLSKKYAIMCGAAAAILGGSVFSSQVQAALNWDAFQIRDSNGDAAGGTTSSFSEKASNAGIDVTVTGGEKVGYGTSDLNGQNIGSITSVTWTQTAAPTGLSPYVNVWIKKGTEYALLTPTIDFTGGGGPVNINGEDWGSLNVSMYGRTDYSNLDWLETGAKRNGAQLLHANDTPFTIAQLGALGVTLDDPNPGAPQGGASDPKHGSAFNLIFGDSGGDWAGTYSIDNVTVVPEPGSLGLVGLAGLALLARRSRRSIA